MNEQIKKLAEKAGFGVYKDDEIYTAKLEHLPITENMQKFADLLIEECAMVAYRKGFCQECGGGHNISKDIRDHFRITK